MKPDRIQYGLASLPGWRQEGQTIRRDYHLPSTLEALEFVRFAALTGERLGRQASVEVCGTSVAVRFGVRVGDPLCEADFEAAKALDADPENPET